MSTHRLFCPCGLDVEIDGWLDAVEIRALHNRAESCDAVVDLKYTAAPVRRTCPCGLKERPGSCGWCEE